jgi:hypothetical protein
MLTNHPEIVKAIKERCKRVKASAYTEKFTIDGVEYCYMTEVDPHRDEPVKEENFWTIRFVAVKPNYFFIYNFDGQQFCIEPELDKKYSFNFTELHALLKKKNVKHFDNEDAWGDTLHPDDKLACIFVLEE